MSSRQVLCPLCGARMERWNDDKVNNCDYCGSPVLGPSQSRDCVNHPETLAKGVCHVCGDLLCEDCLQYRVGDYGGKLFTIVNCEKSRCVSESRWAKPLNREYQRLTNMDWADKSDNIIFRVTGLGALLMMIFELFFVISLLYIQYFTSWGLSAPPYLPYFFLRGDLVVILSILGNLLSAILLQTSLQVYIHERQLGAGLMLSIILIIESVFLYFRGIFFNLLSFPNPLYPWGLFAGFSVAVLMVFFGSLGAIYNGLKKRNQIKYAKQKLGLR